MTKHTECMLVFVFLCVSAWLGYYCKRHNAYSWERCKLWSSQEYCVHYACWYVRIRGTRGFTRIHNTGLLKYGDKVQS